MRWNVEGADASTGRDRLVTVEADDKQQAEVAARMKGLLVSAIHPVRLLTPAEKLDQMMSGKLDASTLTSTTINEQMTDAAAEAIANAQPSPRPVAPEPSPQPDPQPPPTIEYRNAPALNVQFAGNRVVPDYIHLRIAGTILGIFAALAYLAGVISFVLGFMAFIGSTYLGSPMYVMSAIVTLLATGSPLLAGAILHGFAAICFALRDVARNSFRNS